MARTNEWQAQLLSAALSAAVKAATEYATDPAARDRAVNDVRTKLAQVDYNAVAKTLSRAIDQAAAQAKNTLNEAIDTLQANAEDAVEMAAERAKEQLGVKKKGGKGKLFFGLLIRHRPWLRSAE